MWFDTFSFFAGSLDLKIQQDYFSYLKNGLLIDTDPLYLLIVGKYHVDNNKNLLKLHNNFEIADYEVLRRFLNAINPIPMFITPHIFTKFIHLLWSCEINEKDFKGIIDTFLSQFTYIGEKYIHKDTIMNLDQFKNKYYDLSNTSLIMTAEKHNHNSVLTCENKCCKQCEEGGDILTINFGEIKSAIQSLPAES